MKSILKVKIEPVNSRRLTAQQNAERFSHILWETLNFATGEVLSVLVSKHLYREITNSQGSSFNFCTYRTSENVLLYKA